MRNKSVVTLRERRSDQDRKDRTYAVRRGFRFFNHAQLALDEPLQQCLESLK